MRSIQEVGIEILKGAPKPFYVFCGDEWGIKRRYIESLKSHYNGEMKECPNVKGLLSMFKKKRLVPLVPSLYVVRYDEEFIQSLDEKASQEIEGLNISGTVVLIYESPKAESKFEKYLPQFSVAINKVAPSFVFKYLKSDFPSLSDQIISIVQEFASGYGESYVMCSAMSKLPSFDCDRLTDEDVGRLFGKTVTLDDTALKRAIASRNINKMISSVESYSGDLSSVYYLFLSCMVDIEKDKSSRYKSSDVKDFCDRWTINDIYFMFLHSYEELKVSRSSKSYDTLSSILYLCYLTQLDPIPPKEALK